MPSSTIPPGRAVIPRYLASSTEIGKSSGVESIIPYRLAVTEEYDFLVLGGGSAGYAAARTAAKHCERVAVVDGSDPLGGLCILRGCMPSKTLLYSAEILHLARRGAEFGLEIGEANANLEALQRRKQDIIGEFAEYRQGQLNDGRFALHRATARFTGSHTVALSDGKFLTAPRILIATGSVLNRPAVEGLDLPGIWSSDDVLGLSTRPDSVIVLGGGSIACELAQFLARVGSEVVQIQRSGHLLSGFSREAAVVVEEAFRAEGISLFTGTGLQRIEATPAGFSVSFEHEGRTLQREARNVLNALGRKPNTASLDLAKAGIETADSGHIVTGAHQETNVEGIYAAGDVAGPHEIVHLAVRQGEVAASHAFGAHSVPLRDDSLVRVVFTDPQVATAGLPEETLREREIDCVSASHPFEDSGKAILMEAKRGFVRTWVERESGRVRAAECVGKDAGELIHAVSSAIHLGASVTDLVEAPWYHPTLSEIWLDPLEDCLDALAG